jgi:hypothetical protein
MGCHQVCRTGRCGGLSRELWTLHVRSPQSVCWPGGGVCLGGCAEAGQVCAPQQLDAVPCITMPVVGRAVGDVSSMGRWARWSRFGLTPVSCRCVAVHLASTCALSGEGYGQQLALWPPVMLRRSTQALGDAVSGLE